jgi:dTDP-L-rhamnose 4-epimerase
MHEDLEDPMDVLVTGGAGFIGSATCAELSARGHRVRVLDSLDPSVHPGASARRREEAFSQVDLRDEEALLPVLAGVDAVVHLAAKVGIETSFSDLASYVSTNTLGTAALLSAMRRTGVDLLVAASSMVVYGEGAYSCPRDGASSPVPRLEADLERGDFEPRCACGRVLTPELTLEDAALVPRSAYALTKLQTEELAQLWGLGGGRASLMRYHNVYGPGMPKDTPYAGVASLWRSSLARGEAPQVFEDGGQRRDFVHVRDVARANVLALEHASAQRAGWVRPFNVGSGTPGTVLEVATALARAAGGPEPELAGRWRREDVRHVTASSERAQRELGYRARVTLAAGLEEFALAPLRGQEVTA